MWGPLIPLRGDLGTGHGGHTEQVLCRAHKSPEIIAVLSREFFSSVSRAGSSSKQLIKWVNLGGNSSALSPLGVP